MAEPERPADGRSPARRLSWSSPLRIVLGLLFVAGVVYAVVRQWEEVRPLLAELSPDALGLATVSVFAGIYATFLAWRAIVVDLGYPLSHRAGMQVFFISQLGKYLPGVVWPIMMQMRLGAAYRIPVRASGAAGLVFLLMVFGSGLVVAVPILPLLGTAGWSEYWWTALVLVFAVAAALPPVLNRLIAFGLRLTRREPLPRPMSFRGIVVAAAWSVVAWIGYGLHVWALAADLGATRTLWLYVVCTGAFAAAFCAGFLVPVAPAGAGAREGMLILLLGAALTAPQVIVIAVVSRLLFTVLDALWAAVAAAGVRMSPPPAVDRT